MFTPTERRADGHERYAFRALIGINRQCKVRAVPMGSFDIVGVEIETVDDPILLILAYDPRVQDS